MRLTDRDRRILKTVELNADLSTAEIAKSLRLKTHSVAYCLVKLKEAKILGPRRASINTYRLGFTDFHLVFSLSVGNSTKRESFVSTLKNDPAVAWFADIGGAHQFAVSVRVKQVSEVFAFMSRIRKTFPNYIRGQELSIVSAVTSYGRNYLHASPRKSVGFQNRSEGPALNPLDSIDFRILRGLSELNHASERDLARLLGMPFSTVRRRINLLEQLKVINGYYHHIDVTKLGYQIFKLLIFTRSQDPHFLKRLEEYAGAQESVVHYLESIGSWQNELVIEVQEATHAAQLASQIHERFESHIDAIHVVPLFAYHKAMAFPGLEAAKHGNRSCSLI